MHELSSGSNVVVAIIGGTLLGLALTRPRFRWIERLDDSSRQYAEVVTTIVAFVMGGYVFARRSRPSAGDDPTIEGGTAEPSPEMLK